MLNTNELSLRAAPAPARSTLCVYVAAPPALAIVAELVAEAIEAHCLGATVVSTWHDRSEATHHVCERMRAVETAHVVVALWAGATHHAVAYALRKGVCLLWVGTPEDTAPEGEHVIAVRPGATSATTEVVVRWLEWMLETGRWLAEASGTVSPDAIPLCVPTPKLLEAIRDRRAQAQ